MTTSGQATSDLASSRFPHLPSLSPLVVVGGALVLTAAVLFVREGWTEVAQATINGLVTGSYFALGAAGLTLVYGVLKLLNFAHGEFLTFGAYMAVLGRVVLDLPLAGALVLAVMVTTALALLLEVIMWRPMRGKGAGTFQLLLMALGLAFVIRYTIQLIAGTEVRQVGANVTASVRLADLHIGRTQLWAALIAFAALLSLAVLLRSTRLGKQIRALADNPELAETTGIDTNRIVLATWALAGALAGLAGVVYGASIGVITPQLGFGVVLSLFAAVILGGIGNAYGALAGGLLIGIVQEWSTLVVAANLKVAVSFAVMILVLILRPQGIFGQARFAER
jgi:neutral amino acid transport system permease protein